MAHKLVRRELATASAATGGCSYRMGSAGGSGEKVTGAESEVQPLKAKAKRQMHREVGVWYSGTGLCPAHRLDMILTWKHSFVHCTFGLICRVCEELLCAFQLTATHMGSLK